MQQLIGLVTPMLAGVGIFRMSAGVIDRTVSDRLLRVALLLFAFAVWGTWHLNYVASALIK